MKFVYRNDLKELEQLAKDIELFSEQVDLPSEITYALNLCLDEVLTNIISYGIKHHEAGDETIVIEMAYDEDKLSATIRDNGLAFNPLEEGNLTPDIDADIEDRDIGGLGVYFLDQYMDDIEYERRSDHNILKLTKCLNKA